MLPSKPNTIQIKRTEHTGFFTQEHINHKLDSWHACWLQLDVQKNMLCHNVTYFPRKVAPTMSVFEHLELHSKVFQKHRISRGMLFLSYPYCLDSIS